MEIRRDGTWFYEGTPIGRKPLVRLFSTILKLEDGQVLTSSRRSKRSASGWRTRLSSQWISRPRAPGGDQVISFTTNVGRRGRGGARAPDPRCARRGRRTFALRPCPRGLEALIDRKSFYRLVDLGEAYKVDGTDWFGVWSDGVFFPIIEVSELDA
jgi:hypothetical protein